MGHQFIGGGVIYDGPKIPRSVEENIQQQHRVRNQHNLGKKEKKNPTTVGPRSSVWLQ